MERLLQRQYREFLRVGCGLRNMIHMYTNRGSGINERRRPVTVLTLSSFKLDARRELDQVTSLILPFRPAATLHLFKFVLVHEFINYPGSCCPEVLQVPFEPFFTPLALYIAWLDRHGTLAGPALRKPHPA